MAIFRFFHFGDPNNSCLRKNVQNFRISSKLSEEIFLRFRRPLWSDSKIFLSDKADFEQLCSKRRLRAHCGSGQIALHALTALKLAASPRIHCCVAEANAAIQTECSNSERMNSQTTILAAVRLFCQPCRDSLAALSMQRVSTLSQYAFDRAAMCSARSPSSHLHFNKRLQKGAIH